jgi:signal transduction histidine kinase
MNIFTQLDLRQRYNIVVFIAITFASILLIVSIHAAISKYAYEYSSKYWANYTKTFSDSASSTVVLDSAAGGTVITNNLHSDKNIISATIYSAEHKVFASSGQADRCHWLNDSLDKPTFIEMPNYWCFSSPIKHQDGLVGSAELVVSKTDYNTIVHSLMVASVVIVLAFSLLIFFMVSYFSGLFTSTIVEMVEVLKVVGQGGRGQRVELSGAADIEMMGGVFNDMLIKIELNEQLLEQMVADRTNELKLALDTSQSANAYKSQIMALVSHEMKTPVHNAIGLMQIVKEEISKIPDFDSMVDYQSRALANTNDLKDMIENILLQGMLEANRFKLKHSSVEVKSMIVECSENVSSLRTRNRNKLVMSGNDAVIVSDPDALRHVINNLIGNACKFTQDGEIHIKWWLDPNQFSLQVTDTGCGIAKENHQHIFEAFWQEPQREMKLGQKLGRKYGGHGLGLAITKQLVERLNGNITVMPNSTKGTIFMVEIPSSEGRFDHPLKAGTGQSI